MKLGTADTSTIYKSDACSGKLAESGSNKKIEGEPLVK
jgi:hypothetical protein